MGGFGEGKQRKKRRKKKRERKREMRATCPILGHVTDAEGNLALTGRQGHLRSLLQEDGCAHPRAPQEPCQVGGLLAYVESQVQSVTRHLQLGVRPQVPRHCREAGDRGALEGDS